MAVVAHRDGRILILQKSGYSVNTWRIPQGTDVIKSQGITAALADDKLNDLRLDRVKAILEERVGCCDPDCLHVGEIRRTGIRTEFDFPAEDLHSWDSSATTELYIGKNLSLYIAEFFCRDQDLRLGHRVETVAFVPPDQLRGKLPGEEYAAVEKVLATYCIDVMKYR